MPAYWTRCACGHIAQDHNKPTPTAPAEDPQPQDWGCDRCACAAYTGIKVEVAED